jgi:WD40 repeat protein
MYKIFLSVMVCAFLLVACGQTAVSTSVVTAIPFTPTAIPSTTLDPAILLAEKDIETQTGTAYSLDWSPDGETLAIASGVEITLLSADLEQSIAVFRPSSGALTATWSSDQSEFATVVGLRNPKITLWDIANDQLTLAQEISAGSDQFGASWSLDGKLLATLANDRKSIFQTWDTSTWKLLNRFDLPYANPRHALNWSVDGKTIYDAGELNEEVVYFGLNVNDGSVQELGKLPVEEVFALTFSPDLKKIAAADEKGKVQILEMESGSVLAEFQSVDAPADLAWNPKNSTLAILGYETALQLWSVPN